jgi:predicted nucleic acid-binding protein
MSIFVDTAAFLAVLNANDRFHPLARQTWGEILSADHFLLSSNYILLETTALLQHRFGVEAVRLFESDILPVVEITWVDKAIHKQAMSALLAANLRNLSLVDCTSFEIMRETGLDTVFTFDTHFHEQGFKVIPEREIAHETL